MANNRESDRVKKFLQERSSYYVFSGLVTIVFGFSILILDGITSIFLLIYIFLGFCLALGGVNIRSKSTVQNLYIHGILLILMGIWTVSITVYSTIYSNSQTTSSNSQTTSPGLLAGGGQIYSGLKIFNAKKKTERLIKEGYFLCPNCSFEQWSGYQTCQKCGHKFQD
jgi:uncharacterized membrane protein HdeD (DUF308 family)